MEKSIRVRVANRPRLMRETILTTLPISQTSKLSAKSRKKSEIFDNVKRTLPDFVVTALDCPGERPLICDALLREHPEVRVIAVAQADNYVVYYWASLDIHSSDIEPSEEGVLNVLRSKLAAVCRFTERVDQLLPFEALCVAGDYRLGAGELSIRAPAWKMAGENCSLTSITSVMPRRCWS